jgi:hypothetical protein
MNRTRKGIRSTTKLSKEEIEKGLEEAKKKLEDTEKDFNPPQVNDAEVELFVNATIGDQNEGTVYTDQTAVKVWQRRWRDFTAFLTRMFQRKAGSF